MWLLFVSPNFWCCRTVWKPRSLSRKHVRAQKAAAPYRHSDQVWLSRHDTHGSNHESTFQFQDSPPLCGGESWNWKLYVLKKCTKTISQHFYFKTWRWILKLKIWLVVLVKKVGAPLASILELVLVLIKSPPQNPQVTPASNVDSGQRIEKNWRMTYNWFCWTERNCLYSAHSVANSYGQ